MLFHPLLPVPSVPYLEQPPLWRDSNHDFQSAPTDVTGVSRLLKLWKYVVKVPIVVLEASLASAYEIVFLQRYAYDVVPLTLD